MAIPERFKGLALQQVPRSEPIHFHGKNHGTNQMLYQGQLK